MSEEKNIPNQETEDGSLLAGQAGKNIEVKKEKNEQSSTQDMPTTNQVETTNQQLQTPTLPTGQSGVEPQLTNMEVHKHPHHPTHKKKWGEYFLEFLMIFLAVTLGFIAENVRERITESHREKEFAQQLYSELREDSVVAAQKISERKHKEKTMEYVAAYFADSSLDNLPERFYPALTMSLYLINRYAFEPKDGMLSQLRNSGSLRYFKSVYLQKLLGDLSVCINNIRFRNDQEYQYFANPIKPFMLKYFDFNWLTQLRNVNDTSSIAVLVYDYEKFNFHVKGVIRNKSILDRSEASSMILFYKQMLVSTRTLQLNEYVVTNHKILDELRHNYRLNDE